MTEPSADGARPARAGSDAGRGSVLDDVPWKPALVVGIGAFAVGIVLVTGLVMAEGVLDESLADDPDGVDSEGDGPGLLTVLGWLYFGTQFIDLDVSTPLGPMSIDMFGELMDEAVIPAVLWRLVPVVVLIGAGYLLASRVLPATATEAEGAKVGATVTVGYLLAVVFGAQLFAFTGESGVAIEVDFADAVLLSGLLYPILLGALGGYLAVRRGAAGRVGDPAGPRA